MKKIITIGDIHGRNSWKDIIDKYDISELHKIVFVGDYVDSFDISNEKIEQNLLDIINLKKENIDKVVLLLGNHDLHYIISNINPTAGYRGEAYHTLNSIFKTNIDFFQMVYQEGNYIWSHAGITETYYRYVLDFVDNHRLKEFIDLMNYETVFNSLLAINEYKHLWKTTKESGGVREYPSLEWSRPNDVLCDNIPVLTQIVGHTNHETIQYLDRFIIVDNLGYETKELYLEI
jgi:predicted MPP superfamily phosphohydrolase